MNQFEKQIGETFQTYRDAKLANLFFLNPPMRIAGMHGRVPCFVQAGKAPYDVAGFYYDRNATSIGVELKETTEHEHSLSIVGPDKKGSGLQYHQLEALVNLHYQGGIALLVWSNGGEIGWADGNTLVLAKLQYDTSLKAEAMKKTPAKGSRSIQWAMFRTVKYGLKDMPLWLPSPPAPCERKSA
jgi:penicillin-binding protein-related factor A (putative recombinase)